MKQFAIVGLGKFGSSLATHLYRKGHEVLVMDKDPRLIQEIKDQVSRAVVADATDVRVLDSLGIQEVDAAVVCIGSDLGNSILVALNLKDLGVKQVMAKATSEAHGRILLKIGVSDYLFPERDMAISLAERLQNPNMLDYLPFLEGYSIIKLPAPKEFVGKALQELDLINRFSVQVVAVQELVPKKLMLIPTAKFVIKEKDTLIVLGPNESLEMLRDKA